MTLFDILIGEACNGNKKHQVQHTSILSRLVTDSFLSQLIYIMFYIMYHIVLSRIAGVSQAEYDLLCLVFAGCTYCLQGR